MPADYRDAVRMIQQQHLLVAEAAQRMGRSEAAFRKLYERGPRLAGQGTGARAMTADEQVAEIIGGWLRQREQGEWPDPQDVIASHPDLAGELSARFAAMALVDAAVSSLPDLPVPEVLGEYRILREIGRGGMGVVYEAEQESMGRRVA